MNTYYIKCAKSKVPTLMQLAVMLGILRPDPDNAGVYVPALVGVAWDVIGPVLKSTGVQVPVAGGGTRNQVTPIKMPNDEEAWHANLRVPFDSLLEYAQGVYAQNPSPQLGAALAGFGEFFLLTPGGDQDIPSKPARVFA